MINVVLALLKPYQDQTLSGDASIRNINRFEVYSENTKGGSTQSGGLQCVQNNYAPKKKNVLIVNGDTGKYV